MLPVGGNFESGRIGNLQNQYSKCSVLVNSNTINNPCCAPLRSSGSPQLQSTYIASKQTTCGSLQVNSPIYTTNCDLQLSGSSVYLSRGATTQSARISAVQAATSLNQPRFASYIRWTPLPPMLPLPALANSAGQSRPIRPNCAPDQNSRTTNF